MKTSGPAVPLQAPGLRAPAEWTRTPVSLLPACADAPPFVCFQGFTYVLHEGECCGTCLPSACEVVTGSPRGDSQSYWKSVGLGQGGWEGGRGPHQPPRPSGVQCCPWFRP